MSRTPEQIIDEFETRRAAAKLTARRRFARRTWELVQLGVLIAAVIYFEAPKPAFLVPLLICLYLVNDLKTRWAMQDELQRLKQELDRRAPGVEG